jgi:hypothetical protein
VDAFRYLRESDPALHPDLVEVEGAPELAVAEIRAGEY